MVIIIFMIIVLIIVIINCKSTTKKSSFNTFEVDDIDKRMHVLHLLAEQKKDPHNWRNPQTYKQQNTNNNLYYQNDINPGNPDNLDNLDQEYDLPNRRFDNFTPSHYKYEDVVKYGNQCIHSGRELSECADMVNNRTSIPNDIKKYPTHLPYMSPGKNVQYTKLSDNSGIMSYVDKDSSVKYPLSNRLQDTNLKMNKRDFK